MSQATDTRITQQGASFLRSTDGSTYAALTDQAEIDAPDFKRDKSDNTAITDTLVTNTPAYQSDASEAKVVLFLTEAQFTTITGDFNSKTNPLYAKVQWLAAGSETTGPTLTFTYWVVSIEGGKAKAKSTEKVMTTMTLEKTSLPVYTAGS